jgi:hypothetical protein
MEQRRLRLGDILDDYCPRERRVTNHAVVAMVDEDVKQTRCTTCDAEHVYKGGQVPRRKKAETTVKLYKQVLAGLTDQETAPSADAEGEVIDEPENEREPTAVAAAVENTSAAEPVESGDEPDDDEPQPVFDDGPVHRPLIRAQLPRIEGAKVERQAPEFTIRQAGGRGAGSFRGGQGQGQGQGNNNGHRFGRGPHRGGRNGAGHGFGHGPGGGSQQRHGGPRKRGR